MKRIELSKHERQILRELKRGNDNIPNGMDNYSYFDAVTTLCDKGLIAATTNYDEVLATRLLSKGYAYLRDNPRLLNPVNWTRIAAIGACVAAIASILGLFISCTIIAAK